MGLMKMNVPLFEGSDASGDVTVRWSQVKGQNHAKNVTGLGLNFTIFGSAVAVKRLFTKLQEYNLEVKDSKT